MGDEGRRLCDQRFGVLVVSFLAWQSLVANTSHGQHQVRAGEDLPEVSVTLLGPLAAVEGVEWPLRPDGKPISASAVQKPCRLTVKLPSGRSYSFVSREIVIMDFTDGVITGVNVRPVPDVRPFTEWPVVAEGVLKEMGLNPTAEVRANLERWKREERLPGIPPAVTTMMLDDKTKLYIEIRSHPNMRGYWLNLSFQATVEATRPYWDPAMRRPATTTLSTTQPATDLDK